MQAARGASLKPSDPDSQPSRPRPRRRYLVVFGVVAALTYAIDLVTKIVAVEVLAGNPVEVVGDLFTLYLARNPGAAFSTGTGFTEVLSVIAVAATLVTLWIARRLGSVGWALGLGFLLGGVVGNLTDRIFRAPGPLEGHVVDFLRLPNFPVFNFADIWINIAAATIIIQSLRGIRVDGERHEDEDQDTSASSATDS